jgi:hypothetical protein
MRHFGCCARTANGHPAAVPAIIWMKSRRLRGDRIAAPLPLVTDAVEKRAYVATNFHIGSYFALALRWSSERLIGAPQLSCRVPTVT